jgi:predicted nucleic acid-binding protein
MLIDTSTLVALFRDRTGRVARALQTVLEGRDYYLTRFTQTELLAGARDEVEWLKLADYLTDQDYVEAGAETWSAAARLAFDLRREGLPVPGAPTCCIAAIAIENGMTLLHNDADFATIAKVSALKHLPLETLGAVRVI